jgi:hypothetical protein
MKNRLEDIFAIQTEFTEKIFREKFNIDIKNISQEDLKKWSKEFILCASKELYESLDELNWKTHRHLFRENNIDNFIEELVDSYKFIMNLLILHGVDSEMFYNKFCEKSKIVDIRYRQDKKLLSIKKDNSKQFIVIDIDGIINNYPCQFLEGSTFKTIYDYKKDSIQSYKNQKKAFRVSGQERENVLNRLFMDFYYKVKEKYKIILLTSRPYEKHVRLFFDTTVWLNLQNIDYDFLFFSKDKEQFLIDHFDKEQIAFCLDDEIENCNKLSMYFKTYLLPNYLLYPSSEIRKVNKDVNVIATFNDIDEIKELQAKTI